MLSNSRQDNLKINDIVKVCKLYELEDEDILDMIEKIQFMDGIFLENSRKE